MVGTCCRPFRGVRLRRFIEQRGRARAWPGGGTESAATLSVSTRAASAATVLYGVSFTVTLPAGVSVTADPATGEVPSGVLHVKDTRALAGARLVRATATTPAALKVDIADALGFTVGDLATIECTVQPATEVTAAAFSISNFVSLDANAAPLAVTPQLSLRTQ